MRSLFRKRSCRPRGVGTIVDVLIKQGKGKSIFSGYFVRKAKVEVYRRMKNVGFMFDVEI